ncbi:extracellular solute-binding protein [Nocardiopsis sediminis]|uniref:Extracellular solute-binding protein n=1 Tax=Nocardiopsis sediminis TaxID=1778267 RepID=A0ABV8FNN0_9ACTN
MATLRGLDRRRFLGLSSAAALGLALSSCGFRPADAVYAQPAGEPSPEFAGRLRVVLWHTWGDVPGEALATLVARFNEEQDDIYVEAQFQGTYDDNAQKVASALVARQVPDIAVFSEVTWPRFYLNDALEPLNGYFTDGFSGDVYNDQLFDEGVLRGESWWLPFARSTPMFYYNRDLFEAAGLPDRAPETWDEMREWAPELHALTASGRPLRTHAYNQIDGDWMFQGAVWQWGGAFSDGLDPTIDSDAVIEAGEWQRRLVADGHAYMAASARTDFTNGVVATIQESTGALGGITEGAGFRVGAGFVPAQLDSGVATGGGGMSIMRNAAAERKEAAFEFLKFAARPENSAYWTVTTGYLPTVKAATEVDELAQKMADDPNSAVSIEQLPTARATDDIRRFGRGVNVALYGGLQRIWADNEPAADVFADVQPRAEAIADQVRDQYEAKVA